MNNFTLMGNLTRDPEFSKVGNENISKCKFTLAVKRPNARDTVDFIPCVAWRTNAENINKYFIKGRKILVSGYVTSSSYTDANGRKASGFDWNVVDWEFCDRGQAVPTEMDTGTYVDAQESEPVYDTVSEPVKSVDFSDNYSTVVERPTNNGFSSDLPF